jgi:hypothetical protein
MAPVRIKYPARPIFWLIDTQALIAIDLEDQIREYHRGIKLHDDLSGSLSRAMENRETYAALFSYELAVH